MDREAKRNSIRIRIIVLWILVIIVTGVVFYCVEGKLYREKAKTGLLEQAENITNLIPDILENNYCADVGSVRVMFSKLDAVAHKLLEYETIDQAKPFLDDLKETAGIADLIVSDRDGNLLYGSSDDVDALGIDLSNVGLILDSRFYEIAASELRSSVKYSDYVQNFYLSKGVGQTVGSFYSWGVGTRWLIAFSNTRPLAQLEIRDYFDWRNVIQRISVGDEGFLVAIKADDGTIVSNPDSDLNGRYFNALELSVKGVAQIQNPEDIMAAFEGEDTVREVSVRGVEYFATRINLDNVIILALLPSREVSSDIAGDTAISVVLVALITGLGVLFAMLHLNDGSDVQPAGEQTMSIWNRTLSSKLKIAGVIAVGAVLLISIYLDSLSSYADAYKYSTTKAGNVVTLLEGNQDAVDKLEEWFNEEYLTRTRILKCILRNTEPAKITRSYIDGFCEDLGFRYIYLFDGDGKIVATNSRYDSLTIDDDSPFKVVLEGKPELVVSSEYDSLIEETLTKVAVSMVDDDGSGDGLILVYTSSEEPRIIKVNLGYRSAFKQVSMADDSIVMVVETDTYDICYMATVKDGDYVAGGNSFDYKGTTATAAGISEEKLLNESAGNIIFRDKLYFMSVKQNGRHYFLVLKPQSFTDLNSVVSVLIVVAATLVFSLVLPHLACSGNPRRKKAAKVSPVMPRVLENKVDNLKKDVKLLFADVLRARKPFFEERWAKDCRKWKDKTAQEKFTIILRNVLLLALLAITVHYYVSGDDSIWYYCFNGEWGSGINLSSITFCLIVICVLIIGKAVIHKLLFLIAKASNRKGETLCYLLDRYCPYILFLVGLFSCLSNFGVNTKALTLTGGAVGVIFGIGCQTVVADILAGFVMTIEGVVHNGDLVSLADSKIVLSRAPGMGPGPGGDENLIVLCVGTRTIMLKCGTGVKVIRNNEFKNFVLQPVDGVQPIQ